MIKIGLTGGIASGKSQTGRFLAEMGAHVIDADRVAHEAYAPDTQGFYALTAEFGPEIIGENGAVDRAKLGARVFGNPGDLARLTAIVWPLTRDLLQERLNAAEAEDVRVAVLEAAVMFDAGWQDLCDEVWLVVAPRDAVLQRLRDQRGIEGEEAQRRLAVATDEGKARRKATRVIENNGSLEELRAKVAEALAAATRGS